MGIWDRDDGYENWVQGKIVEIWPKFPKPPGGGMDREWAEALPYKVAVQELAQYGPFFCHRDEHSLIRSPENVPRVLGKRVTGRMEKRRLEDGTLEMFDHVTLKARKVRE